MSPNVNNSLCWGLFASRQNLKQHSLGLCHFWSVRSSIIHNKGGLTCARWVMFNLNRFDVGDYWCSLTRSHTISKKCLTEFWSLYTPIGQNCLPGKCLNSLSTGNASRNFQESFFVQSIHLKYSIYFTSMFYFWLDQSSRLVTFLFRGKCWLHKCHLFQMIAEICALGCQ